MYIVYTGTITGVHKSMHGIILLQFVLLGPHLSNLIQLAISFELLVASSPFLDLVFSHIYQRS